MKMEAFTKIRKDLFYYFFTAIFPHRLTGKKYVKNDPLFTCTEDEQVKWSGVVLNNELKIYDVGYCVR